VPSCRSLWLQPDSSSVIRSEPRFFRTSSVYWHTYYAAYVGVWGKKLQYILAKETGVPNLLINTAVGATPISAHLASHAPSRSPAYGVPGKDERIYDRAFRKLTEAGLASSLKAIFWYQGESDADSGAALYEKKFDSLYRSWKLDYKGLQKIFTLQINLGCAGGQQSQVRNTQAEIAKKHDDIVIMSTVGNTAEDRDADNCHYTAAGYLKIADKVAPLALKYIYGRALDEQVILPPRLEAATYTGERQITLRFDREVSCQPFTEYLVNGVVKRVHLEDYFFGEGEARLAVSSLACETNSVILQLSKASFLPKKISWLPQIYTNIPTGYTGPWILNRRNTSIGALSFFEREVLLNIQDDFRLYPNPCNNHITFERSQAMKIDRIVVYNQLGEPVSEISSEELMQLKNEIYFPCAGIFFLKIFHAKGVDVQKVVVE
jgi:hypothetical protein